MFYEIYAGEKTSASQAWPDAKHYVKAVSSEDGSAVNIPALNDNMLFVGTTGKGKTTFMKKMAESFINGSSDPFTVFLDLKDDFREYMRPGDRAVCFGYAPNVCCPYFEWNMVKEIRQSDDWRAELDSIADALFAELSEDSRNRFWIDAAKGVFKGFVNVILYRYENCPSNAKVINTLRKMPLEKLLRHLALYCDNMAMLRDYFDYDPDAPGEYKRPKRAGDIMAFLTSVLDKFGGHFLSENGTDTVHDFLHDAYGRRLFLLYDYGRRASANLFFRLMLQKLINSRLSQNVDRSKKMLMVLDEAASLEGDFGLMNAVTLGRGNNLQVILATQSLEKLYCAAPEKNSDHITNASLAGFPFVAAFQPGDAHTRDALQKMAGNAQKHIVTLPLSRYAQVVNQYVTEPVLSAEALSSLGVGECFVKIGASPPARVRILA